MIPPNNNSIVIRNNHFSVGGFLGGYVTKFTSLFSHAPKPIPPFPGLFPDDIMIYIFTKVHADTFTALALTSKSMIVLSESPLILNSNIRKLNALIFNFAEIPANLITKNSFKQKAEELNGIFVAKFTDEEIKCTMRKAILNFHGTEPFCKLALVDSTMWVLNYNHCDNKEFYGELVKEPEGIDAYHRMETILNKKEAHYDADSDDMEVFLIGRM